ncbi:MAG: protein-glutamate O-methyltransferase CheR [Desulfobacteraceae bacterium]|nr:protein-glutamate O-methyltransferase CheR [Desulfobacteraceae bacterium]
MSSPIDLNNKDFNELSQLVYNECGINIHKGKLELLKSKIAKRMRITKISSTSLYLQHLKKNKSEITEFIDTVTTNHSFFFRENRGIEAIIEHLSKQNTGTSKNFKLWCAACSTGDEPYSVTVQMLERDLSFSLLATDISHSVLKTAARGIYSVDRVRNVPTPVLHRYFQKGTGKSEGFIRVRKEIQRHIAFKKFNLITDPIPTQSFDVVLCRNVMIYFDNPTTEKVVNKLYQALVPGGLFIIGQAESLLNMDHKFKPATNIPSTHIK